MVGQVSLSRKIALACLVPIVGCVGFASLSVWKDVQKYQTAQSALTVTAFAPIASALVHELQKERGASNGFVASKGAQFSEVLSKQKPVTDEVLKGFTGADWSDLKVNAAAKEQYALVQQNLERLSEIRSRVQSLGITPPETFGYYTQTIDQIMGMIDVRATSIIDSRTARFIITFTSTMRAKEDAGQERAIGTRGFASERFGINDLSLFTALSGRQESRFSDIRRFGDEAQKQTLAQILAMPSSQEVEVARKAASSVFASTERAKIEAPAWFKASTERINQLKAFEDRIVSDLNAAARADADAALRSLMINASLAGLLSLLAIGFCIQLIRSVTKPMNELVEDILALAKGDTQLKLKGKARGDEIGAMSRAVSVLRDNALDRMRLEAQAREEQTRGEQRRALIDQAVRTFKTSTDQLMSRVKTSTDSLEQVARSLSGISSQASSQAEAATGISHETSGNVQTVASAAEELSASIQEISSQLGMARQVVGRASEITERSSANVSSLAESAQKIDVVVTLIRNIAEQTNLLALNATIEAARAGEAGRGFAVVAQEVKQLATQTAKATDEIAAQIGSIQSSTTETVEGMQAIAKVVVEIESLTSAIAAAVEEQGSATSEISRAIEMAALGSSELAQNVQSVGQAIGETNSSVDLVLTSSSELAQTQAQLNESVEGFLKTVAA